MNRFLLLIGLLLAAVCSHAQEIGDILCTDGTYVLPADFASSGKEAKGVIFWLDPTDNSHGLAVGLKDLGPAKFSTIQEDLDTEKWEYFYQLMNQWDGKERTDRLRSKDPDQYPIVSLLTDEEYTAGWFIPCYAQLRAMYGVYPRVLEGIDAIQAVDPSAAMPLGGKFYWTCSTNKPYYATIMKFDGMAYGLARSDGDPLLRPIIAF